MPGIFQAGNTVPASGVYKAVHEKHARTAALRYRHSWRYVSAMNDMCKPGPV
jgi:hypothetical protein